MSEFNIIKSRKGINWAEEIVNYLKEHPSGLTITDIAEGIGTTRVTIHKYIKILLKQEKIFAKEVGVYNLYFSSERLVVPSHIVRSFYKGILIGLKEKLSDKEDFKKLGYVIADNMKIELGDQFPKSLKPQIKSFKDFIQFFGKIYPFIDIISEKHVNIEEEISEDRNKAIYHLKNVNLLNLSEDFIYHYYIFSGILEKTISRVFKKNIDCNILSIDIKNKSVIFSIEISNS
jgi:hypothetical protein